jgi:membrane associated rhomboid family serine protease
MSVLDNLERKFGRYAVPNVTMGIVIGQAFLYLFSYSGQLDISRAMLIPELVLAGEWWRLLTFPFIPPSASLFWIFFALYAFYLMGGALEGHWGAFRYNVFLLTGYLLTVAASFLFPYQAASNVFVGGSVFLAFAALYPDFQFYIFFILPVKVKWLALLAWIGYGRDIWWRMKTGQKKMAEQARSLSGTREAFHRCASCAKTDITHPDMEFLYCPDCGGLGYCMDHIDNHEHRKK